MGCVLGREAQSNAVSEANGAEKRRDLSVNSSRKLGDVTKKTDNKVEVGNEEAPKEEKTDGSQLPRSVKKKSRSNPRLSNPPNHVRGEQVAAGWPSWLSDVAGPALNGWIPRRADTFQKLDKVGHFPVGFADNVIMWYLEVIVDEWKFSFSFFLVL